MDFFNYKNGKLHAEDVCLETVANEIGTPFYCYSKQTLERHLHIFQEAFSDMDALVCFALKANSNHAVLKTLAKIGSGADVVSGGELIKAIEAGIDGKKIVFSGVGKTKAELKLALEKQILQINVESAEELEALNQVAVSMNTKAPIAFRVNPDVDAKTHAKISTGKKENKFGIDINKAPELYEKASKMDGIEIKGVDVHIGSQLLYLDPFRKAFNKLKTLILELKEKGINIEHIDLGGGLGIPYDKEKERGRTPDPKQYADVVKEVFSDLDCKIILEPGRLIAGNSGVLVSKVIYVKKGDNRNFVILDVAMNDLVRPALYDAYHGIRPVDEPKDDAQKAPFDVVGPICETGDTFAKQRMLPPLKSGDLISIESSGAYGSVMSSFYNSRAMAPEVMVNGEKYAIIRKRITNEDMKAFEQTPDWLD